uniref:nicotinamidase n=1 Tax=Plectus sambesii TaxID=2011161 RepID=A0A914XSC7_9BILA
MDARVRLLAADGDTLRDKAQFCAHLSRIFEEEATADDIAHLFDQFDVDRDGRLNDDEFRSFEQHFIRPLTSLKAALLVVDYQNDFIDGSLAIGNGPARENPLEALTPLNGLIESGLFELVVYTLDWHPSNHISFYPNARDNDRQLSEADINRDLRVFDKVRFSTPACEQVLYPAHCVQESHGAELHPRLTLLPNALFVRKGIHTHVDSYSAFYDNNGEGKTELDEELRARGISAAIVCGLAYDVCVAATAADALRQGLMTAVVDDCSKGLDAAEMDKVRRQLTNDGAAIVLSTRAAEIVKGQYIPWRWARSLADRVHARPSPPPSRPCDN